MQTFLRCLSMALILVGAGCLRSRPSSEPVFQSVPAPAPTSAADAARPQLPKDESTVFETPAMDGLNGKVSRVHGNSRFAVLTFSLGQMPQVGQRLNVYRGDLKVGEVVVSGPRLEDNVVADVVAGDAQAGDRISDR